MGSQQMRIGVLGGGVMAGVHLANLASSERATVVGFAATAVSTEVEALSMKIEAEHMTVDQLLAPGTLDAVVIATPTDTHAEFACRAMEAGMSVFCEKPVARRQVEGNRLAEVAASTHAKMAIGFDLRYAPEYDAARRHIVDGILGEIATVRLLRVNASPADSKPWYGEPARSGGPLLDMAIHDLDWCRWALGPIRRVYARQSGPAGKEVASIVLRLDCGAIAYVDSSWRDSSFMSELEVCGTEGLYRVSGSGDAGFELVKSVPEAPSSYLPSGVSDLAPSDDPYRMEIEAALAWFAGGPEPRAVLADGLAALAVVTAAEESVRKGIPVEVKETS